MMKGTSITVGINTKGYPEKRNIIDPAPPNVQLKKVNDSMKMADYLYFKLRRKNHPFFHNVFRGAGMSKVDLYHFFNVISLGKKPWVVTYENELPRHNQKSAYLVKKLAGRSCKKIIALSHNALAIERNLLENFPTHAEAILHKTVVMHPPQRIMVNDITEKTSSSRLEFAFVGASFFRKGGKEMLNAFIRLLAQRKDVHLTIVSSFAFDHWLDTEYGPADVETCKKLMALYPENITYFSRLENARIMEIFGKSSVALLPSFGETFGYSVLEAQACACPVITTNAWAFPEFNSAQTGWLLDLPLTTVNGGLRLDIGTPEKKKTFSGLMEDKLFETLRDICEHPHEITQKAAACIQQIKNNHSLEEYGRQLQAIYQQAINE